LHFIETTVSISTKILHSDKDHQMPFVDYPNMHIAKPQPPSLKNKKIATSATV